MLRIRGRETVPLPKSVEFPRLSLFGFVALSFALLISWRVPATLQCR